MCEFLGTDLEAPLSVPAEALGEGSVNGDTRKRIAEQKETLRGLVLTKALETYLNQSARP